MIGRIFAFNGLEWRDGMKMKRLGGADYVYGITIRRQGQNTRKYKAMNRIVVIGNGFDKAHGLATGYKDFIDAYWNEFGNEICTKYSNWQKAHNSPHGDKIGTAGNIYHEDDFVKFEIYKSCFEKQFIGVLAKQTKGAYNNVLKKLDSMNDRSNSRYKDSLDITFKNAFLGYISNRRYLKDWVDIENEYYEKLKNLLSESDAELRNQYIQRLNQDFEAVKKLLEKHLTKIVEDTKPSLIPSIQKAFESFIEPQDIAHRVRTDFIESAGKKSGILEKYAEQETKTISDSEKLFWRNQARNDLDKRLQDDAFKTKYCRPENTLLLNFNYTNIAERLYANEEDEVIHIHGELGNPHNPIIFGYGDELDDDYKQDREVTRQ